MIHRWTFREFDLRARDELSRALSVSPLVAAVLAARGVARVNEARAFLSPTLNQLPDPALIAGMGVAAARLAEAVCSGQSVWVYADYDVDGVTSAALLAEFLSKCGSSARVYLPRRDREGYGLHAEALEAIRAQGGRVVVTADCGIAAVEAAGRAAELGLDLIITDHHTPGAKVPLAAAVVNPKLSGSTYPDPTLAGVGVAWNVAAATRRELRERNYFVAAGVPEPDLRSLLDLVALGTVADVVPLRGVNRVLTHHGLEVLNRGPRAGIVELCRVAGLTEPLRAGHLGFQIGPRLNAAGRMAQPDLALEVLATRDTAAAKALAEELDGLNRARQHEERTILEQATARVEAERWVPERWSLVAEGEGWHPGVIGIVASRLAEQYHRPSVVLSVLDGRARGSARSIRGLDLHAALNECADLLDRFGGHAAAAGLQLPVASITAFRERFEAVVRAALLAEDLLPEVLIDAEVGFAELGLPAVAELASLEPFGPGNPGPVFATRGARLLDARTMGGQGEHLRLRLEEGGRRLDAVVWRRAAELSHLTPGDRLDLAFTPHRRTWRGVESVQLQVSAVRGADA